MQTRLFKILFISVLSLISSAEAQTPVIRGSESNLEEFQKYLADSPRRITYAKALLSKKLDNETNQLIDNCLELQFDTPDKAEDICEQALTAILKKPITLESKNIVREMLSTLDQKSIFKKGKNKWNQFLARLRKQVTRKNHEQKDISSRQLSAWLKALRQRPGQEDANLYVNGDAVESLKFVDINELNHWALVSNSFPPVVTLGSFADFEENNKNQNISLVKGNCKSAKLEKLEGENSYEVFFSEKCKKFYSNPESLFPKYDFLSHTSRSFDSQNFDSSNQPSWLYPAVFAGLILGILALKDKHVAVRWNFGK